MARIHAQSKAMKKDDFNRVSDLESAVSFSKQWPLHHVGYQHHLQLDFLKEMLTKRKIVLRCCISPNLNDLREGSRYGDEGVRRRMFIGSISHGAAEQALFWLLYGRNAPKTLVRITVDRKAMARWQSDLAEKKCKVYLHRDKGCGPELPVEDMRMQDLVYACVSEEEDKAKKGRTILWNGLYRTFTRDMSDDFGKKCITGWVKDYEWRNEYETRIGVILKETVEAGDQIDLDIPDDVIKSMRFTMSPWMLDEEIECQRKSLVNLYERATGEVAPKDLVKKSSMSGALS